MNPEYQRILDSLKSGKEEVPHVNDRVLLIDGLNTFLRSFTVIKHLNPHGNHIGGLTGFLKSLAFTIKIVRPTRVIIVFDGEGGSTNKRYLYPEYKANRNLKRITNWGVFESQQEESESITSQVLRLVDYLKCVPVDLISIDKIEADDVIGCLTKKFTKEVTIVSSDRDYLQLVTDKVTVYSPIKKKYYNPEEVVKEYNVTTTNFLIQKVLLGDDGDNVPGVKGLGPKKLIKLFPELGNDTLVTLDEVLSKCEIGTNLLHSKIKNYQHQLRINEKLMDLHKPNIPVEALQEIEELINNPNKEFDPKTFQVLYMQDKLGDTIPNLIGWLYTNFNELQKYK